MEKEEEGKSVVESVEIRIWTRVEGKSGKVLGKNRVTYGLDPDQFTLSQQQQYEKEHNGSGEVVEHHKIGKPHLVLHGVLISGQNDPVAACAEDQKRDLDISVEKVADLLKFTALWKGKRILEYEVTEGVLKTDLFAHHIEIIVGTIDQKSPLSKPQIRDQLVAAISRHMGVGPEMLSRASRS